jgi:hypothetical protein
MHTARYVNCASCLWFVNYPVGLFNVNLITHIALHTWCFQLCNPSQLCLLVISNLPALNLIIHKLYIVQVCQSSHSTVFSTTFQFTVYSGPLNFFHSS